MNALLCYSYFASTLQICIFGKGLEILFKGKTDQTTEKKLVMVDTGNSKLLCHIYM